MSKTAIPSHPGKRSSSSKRLKMEIRVSAPADGVVKEVFVKKGDVVEREQRLIEMEL